MLEFLRLLWALDHGLQRCSKRMLGSVGVTGPQRLVIRIVGRFPGISAGQLARVILLHASTLSGVLERLESRGLLERGSDPWDKRRALFRLTARGKAVDAQSTGTVEAAVERALGKVPDAQLEGASKVLTALAASLEETLAGAVDDSKPTGPRVRRRAGGRRPRGSTGPKVRPD